MAMAMAKSVAAVKSSVYSVQLSLLDGISDEDKLRAAGKVLTQSEYADVVTERSIVDMCGYPLCTNPLPSTFPHKGRYRISLREHKVYELEETRLFCSSDCLVASKTFDASLPVERDHSSKTLELAAAFHKLGIQDVDQQHQASSSVTKRIRPLIEELDEQYRQEKPIPVALSVPVKTGDSQQSQQANPGTVLFIREENELKVSGVNIAGPSNSIEGYVPQKEFRPYRYKQATGQDHKNLSNVLPVHNELGNSINKKGKSEKTASASKFTERARFAASEKELDFRSCILFDYGQPATPHDANYKNEPASSSSEPVKEPTPHIDIDDQVLVQDTVRQCLKRHNRVSWADHKNLNLVEELFIPNAANGSGSLVDTCNIRDQEESTQTLMLDNSTSKKAAVAINGGSGLLQRQEVFRVRKEQDNNYSQVSLDGRNNGAQEFFSCRKEHEDMKGTRVYNHEGGEAGMLDMGQSKNRSDPIGECVASPQRQEFVGGRDESENIQSSDFRSESLDCTKALIAVSMDAVRCDMDRADPTGGSVASLQRKVDVGGGEEPEDIQSMQFKNENLESAKALVAALTEAAEAVAHGGVDSSEAVVRAGISILPNHEGPSSNRSKQMKDLGKEVADDVENLDPRDCWYSAPPKAFKPELSMFGTLWMALDSWISAASIAHVYGRDSNEEDNFASINGKEYLRQVIIPNGVSAEIERTLAGCISRTLPALVETFRFPVPVSTLEVSLGRFLRTMSFMSAIPAFSSKLWQVVVLLLLDALSVHRLPALRTRFLNGRQSIQKVLASANLTEGEYEIFRDLVLPMGILPDFAAHCGG